MKSGGSWQREGRGGGQAVKAGAPGKRGSHARAGHFSGPHLVLVETRWLPLASRTFCPWSLCTRYIHRRTGQERGQLWAMRHSSDVNLESGEFGVGRTSIARYAGVTGHRVAASGDVQFPRHTPRRPTLAAEGSPRCDAGPRAPPPAVEGRLIRRPTNCSLTFAPSDSRYSTGTAWLFRHGARSVLPPEIRGCSRTRGNLRGSFPAWKPAMI